MGRRYLRPSKENFSSSPAIGIFINELTNSVGNISKLSDLSDCAFWNLNMESPIKEPFKSFVGSISRAVGNDLVDAVVHENRLTLMMWPPISPGNKDIIKSIARLMVPGCRVNLNMRKGKVEIVIGD